MDRHRPLLRLLLAAAAVTLVIGQIPSQGDTGVATEKTDAYTAAKKRHARLVTQVEREAAAQRLAQKVAAAKKNNTKKNGPATSSLSVTSSELGPIVGQGDVPDYFSPTVPNWNYTPKLKKFVDKLPGLGPDKANLLGQYIPVAVPDRTTYPGIDPGVNSDYYEIAVVQYKEKLHSELPPTTLRGYVQIDTPVIPDTSTRFALTYPDGSPILDAQGN